MVEQAELEGRIIPGKSVLIEPCKLSSLFRVSRTSLLELRGCVSYRVVLATKVLQPGFVVLLLTHVPFLSSLVFFLSQHQEIQELD